jgi:hypothetical protein
MTALKKTTVFLSAPLFNVTVLVNDSLAGKL